VESRLIGLLADRVLDILSFEASRIQPVPQIAHTSRVDFLSGLVTIDGTMIALVDLPNLLAERPGEDRADPIAAPTSAPHIQARHHRYQAAAVDLDSGFAESAPANCSASRLGRSTSAIMVPSTVTSPERK
jgi:hypothetical protein